MKSVFFALSALALGAAASPASPIGAEKRSTSKSWAGSNLYFLQGLSDADQNTYINNLASYGAKVVRVWVNSQPGGNTCEKGSYISNSIPALEDTIGQYNEATLDALDSVLVKLAAKGIKALISPHDANLICGANGSDDPYCKTWGPGYFYQEQAAFQAYDNRLSYILNYVGKTSGRTWKSWGEAIMGFDVQNEPMAPKVSECQDNDTYGWLCGRAAHMRSVLGAENAIKIGSGGIGGDFSQNCNFMKAALECPELDMISVHRYAGPEGSSAATNEANWKAAADGWVQQTDKLVYIEEWGFDTTKYDATTEFPANTKDINSAAIPWIHWQVLPQQECSSSDSDHFGIYMNSGTDFASQMTAASAAECLQDWTGVIW